MWRLVLGCILLAIGIGVVAEHPRAQFTNFYPAAPASGSCGSIAIDNTGVDLGNSTTTSYTTGNFTMGSVTCGMLVVCLGGDPTTDDVTSVKWNTIETMTLAAKKIDPGAFEQIEYLYYLLNPTSGAHTITVARSTSLRNYVQAASYSGVQATGQPDATATGITSSPGTTLTTAITTVADNTWIVGCESGYNGNQPPTAGTGLTRRAYDGVFGTGALFDSNGALTPAGSKNFITNRSGNSDRILHAVASFVP